MCAKKFLSTPSARRATIISSIIVLPLSISIHALREEGDIVHGIGESLSFISIHALREEGDVGGCPWSMLQSYFYPRPPRGGRLFIAVVKTRCFYYFYPRPPRGGRHAGSIDIEVTAVISIHALREEGDIPPSTADFHNSYFYPRPPRGGRQELTACIVRRDLFLSTPSARRATRDPEALTALRKFLSTPSARRATVEADNLGEAYRFLSTPSARRATTALWA